MPASQIEAIAHEGEQLAYEQIEGAAPTFVWLGGFKSDMAGTKAQTLADWAVERGQGFVRFDYSGHGRSSGAFEAGTISRWLSDTLAVLDQLTDGPLVLVGSSMGGWLALLAARARADRVKGLLLIAPAADFTERLMWRGFSPKEQRQILAFGRLEQPSEYAPQPNVITRDLIEDGRKHLIFGTAIRTWGPAHILQGMQDPDVPWKHALALVEHLADDPATLSFIRDGDHRLSRDQDIARLIAAVAEIK